MMPIITRRRLTQLTGFASAQLIVQAIGFASGIVLVRHMEQAEYGYYTLALSMAGIATVLTDLGAATAVMALGGQLLGQPAALGRLVADANALHRRLAVLSFSVLVPCFAVMMWQQQAHPWQVAVLVSLIVAAAALNVRTGIALSITRLMGHVQLQQKLDLGINAAKLAVLLVASWVALDATLACAVNLFVAITYLGLMRRHLSRHVVEPAAVTGEYAAALRHQVRKQAPNAIYFVLSSQLAVWLIGIFGNAQRVAEVGALGRLAAVFTVIGAVTSALVLPYFARHDTPAALASGFVGVNAFFAALLLALVSLAVIFPDTILWVLGRRYGELHAELRWMVAAATLSAWGGALYSIGCARGWVLPFAIAAPTGILASLLAASAVDVSTVRGSFVINTVSGLVGAVTAFAYFAWQLRRHSRAFATAS